MTEKKRPKRDPEKLRGTDEPFLRLMRIGGPAVLKLLGIESEEAEAYTFRSVVLKERRIEPDIEGIPVLEGREGRVFVEFQGYSDKFIRYRLLAGILLTCAHDKYKGPVRGGIVYTDESYKTAALPVNPFGEKTGRALGASFEEIVLTDYTKERLIRTDPRLIVLAPFTVSPEKGKTGVLSEAREWKEDVRRVYPEDSVKDALNVLGLLIMNRFRDITREEVVAVLNFDLMDTVAGQQIFEEGVSKGILREAREMVIEALSERFVAVPAGIRNSVCSVEQHDMLKELLRHAIRCSHIKDFEAVLSKVLPVSGTVGRAEELPAQ